MSLKARGLIFWILALYIRIEAPVKTEFAKSIIWSISIPIRWSDSPYLKGLSEKSYLKPFSELVIKFKFETIILCNKIISSGNH